MKKFEYNYKTIMSGKMFIEKNLIMLNELGRNGWEAVGICPCSDSATTLSCLFKRQLQDDNKDKEI